MANRGRPRLSPEDYQRRLEAYCAQYGVQPNPEGLPPFPAGQRETIQHREWIKLYKTHHRLGRRLRGQCERCGAPLSDGSIFCEKHRGADSARADAASATAKERRELLEAQSGNCPICVKPVEPGDPVHRSPQSGRLSAIVHPPCGQLLGAAEFLGPDGLDRARAFLWPPSKPPRGSRRR